MASQNISRTLIIMTKSPNGEHVKTRLSPALSIEKRLALHKAMLRHIVSQALLSCATDIVIAVDGDYEPRFFSQLKSDILNDLANNLILDSIDVRYSQTDLTKANEKNYHVMDQVSGDLGVKMLTAVKQAGLLGLTIGSSVDNSVGNLIEHPIHKPIKNSVLLVGSDCPFIDVDYLNQAFESFLVDDQDQLKSSTTTSSANPVSANPLTFNSVCIGPAHDGGYVLLGMSELSSEQVPTLFEDIPWGTDQVFKKTCDSLNAININFYLLPILHDIDRPEDLIYLKSLGDHQAFSDFIL